VGAKAGGVTSAAGGAALADKLVDLSVLAKSSQGVQLLIISASGLAGGVVGGFGAAIGVRSLTNRD
jgi:hypothetical protein